jgi:hypothetical protein
VGFGHALHPGRPSADEDEGEQAVFELALRALGLLQAVYYGVADVQGVA